MSDLMLDVDQAGELKAAFRRGDWTNQEIKRACEGDTLAQFRQVLLGNAVIVDRQRLDHIKALAEAMAPQLKSESVLDTIIRVDRSVRPVYPDWVKKVMHPKLEAKGLAEYDLATVHLWLHDGQKGGNWVKGERIYDHLKSNNMLEGCLGLRDGEEIKKKGIEVFRKFFGSKAVFLWRSVVRHRDGDLNVPYLIERGGEVVMDWDWLGHVWYGRHPAARFASCTLGLVPLVLFDPGLRALRGGQNFLC